MKEQEIKKRGIWCWDCDTVWIDRSKNDYKFDEDGNLLCLECYDKWLKSSITNKELLLEKINNVELLEELERRIINRKIRLLVVSEDGSQVTDNLAKVNCVLHPDECRLVLNDLAKKLKKKYKDNCYEDDWKD